MLSSALSTNSIGITAYAWYDQHLYLEAGGYDTMGPTLLKITGNALAGAPLGATSNISAYVRSAYEWNWNHQSAHIGEIFLNSNFNPATGNFSSNGSIGHNRYTDFAADAGYQFLGNGTHVFTADGIYTYETQDLQGSFNAGTSSQPHNNLQQVRLALTYIFSRRMG